MEETIKFQLNGKKTESLIDPKQTLLWALRNHFGLTGTKFGCGMGFCGACTVLIDNEPVRSCQLSVGDAAGKNIITVEGLANDGKLHPVQKAFVDHDALQCGFCTPGMIMAAARLDLAAIFVTGGPNAWDIRFKPSMRGGAARSRSRGWG